MQINVADHLEPEELTFGEQNLVHLHHTQEVFFLIKKV